MPRNRFQQETREKVIDWVARHDSLTKTPYMYPEYNSYYTEWLERHYREKEEIGRELNGFFNVIRERLTEDQIDEFVFMVRQLKLDSKKQVIKEIPG